MQEVKSRLKIIYIGRGRSYYVVLRPARPKNISGMPRLERENKDTRHIIDLLPLLASRASIRAIGYRSWRGEGFGSELSRQQSKA